MAWGVSIQSSIQEITSQKRLWPGELVYRVVYRRLLVKRWGVSIQSGIQEITSQKRLRPGELVYRVVYRRLLVEQGCGLGEVR